MKDYTKLFRSMLEGCGFTEQAKNKIITHSSFHQITSDTLIVTKKTKVNRILFVVEGECNYDFEVKGYVSLSNKNLDIKSPNIVGSFAIISGAEYYPYSVKLSNGAYFEFPLDVLDFNDDEAKCFEMLCRNNSQNSMYLTSKNIVQKNNQLIRNSNSFLLILTVVLCYIFLFKTLTIFQSPTAATLFLALYLVIMSIICFPIIKYNGRRPSHFGLTLNHLSRTIKEAIIFSVPILLIETFVKWIFTVVPNPYLYGDNIIGFYNIYGDKAYLVMVMYAIFCFFQEFISRGIALTLCENTFPDQGYPYKAIWLSSMLFAIFHIHYTFLFVLIALILSIYWSWLYVRTRNIIGVSINHIIISAYPLFFLGANKVVIVS